MDLILLDRKDTGQGERISNSFREVVSGLRAARLLMEALVEADATLSCRLTTIAIAYLSIPSLFHAVCRLFLLLDGGRHPGLFRWKMIIISIVEVILLRPAALIIIWCATMFVLVLLAGVHLGKAVCRADRPLILAHTRLLIRVLLLLLTLLVLPRRLGLVHRRLLGSALIISFGCWLIPRLEHGLEGGQLAREILILRQV